MRTIIIKLTGDRRSFHPGERIDGSVTWNCDNRPKAVDVRLLHYTTGKGTRDIRVQQVMRFDDTAESDTRRFSFSAPAGPCSFDGRLVSLTWAVDAIVDMKGFFADFGTQIEIVIAPGSEPIELYST